MKLLSLILAGVAAAAFAAPPAASLSAPTPYVWRNVKVGGGGFIPGIVFSRAERGLAYARSDMGGAYRWDTRRGSWIPLEDGFAEGSYMGVESIAPDPVDPNVVYAAVGVGLHDPSAILRSHDRGDHWDVVPTPFRMGGNEDGRGLGERLAIDPNDTAILYFGSRFDGLQRSPDHGRTWAKVASFPLPGLGLPTARRQTHGGLSFVVYDPAGSKGAPSKTIFAGSADAGEHHLFRSDDAGASWRAVVGGPAADLLPVQAQLDAQGVLYITYSDALGPNGIKRGAVFKLDTHTNAWTDITPDKSADAPAGGYMGLSLDRNRPGALVVATVDRFHPGDLIWRSLDGGATWRNIRPLSHRDVSASPFLLWGKPEADFGWWMAALAIDPFDSDTATYATGATVYAAHHLTDVDQGRPITWTPWVNGIEQTAIITLDSPHDGPTLLSGFGDIGGFAHEELTKSPAGMYADPRFDNTNTIDVAGRASVVVRSGVGHDKVGPTLGLSQDLGRTWRPVITPAPTGDAAITVSADGRTLVVMTPTPIVSRDLGQTWSPVAGAPTSSRLVADRVDSQRFYALDFDTGSVFASTDSGASFADLHSRGLPGLAAERPHWREAPWPLYATPGRTGDLWVTSKAGLFHSTDGGRSFVRVHGDVAVEALGFGKAAPGRTMPTLFAIGSRGETRAIWRSDDEGASWLRVNDAAHEYGRRFRSISGDPRIFGRVYIGTDGRGVLYGEPTGSTSSAQR
ncbi:MAG: xyloglucanase [Caulobacteraceae bacterium]